MFRAGDEQALNLITAPLAAALVPLSSVRAGCPVPEWNLDGGNVSVRRREGEPAIGLAFGVDQAKAVRTPILEVLDGGRYGGVSVRKECSSCLSPGFDHNLY